VRAFQPTLWRYDGRSRRSLKRPAALSVRGSKTIFSEGNSLPFLSSRVLCKEFVSLTLLFIAFAV
jgi:hypothetical protein